MMEIPDWIPQDAWVGYVEMRKKAKKPMTPRAEVMQIKALERFRDAGHDVAAILDQSTANNWTDLYELKDKSGSGNKAKIPQLGKAGNVTAAAAQEWLNDGPMDDSIDMRRRFATMLAGISDYYNSEMSKSKLALYWQALKQFSFEAIEKACWAHIQLADEAGRWMPKAADIIKMIDGGTDDRAQIAWSKVDNAVRVRGNWDDLVFDDPFIHRVIADMGGWIKVSGTPDEKEYIFVGKEFQQRYRAYKQRGELAEYPSRLIGMANAQNASIGRPLLPPILVGDVEKAKAVLKGGAGAPLIEMRRPSEMLKLVANS